MGQEITVIMFDDNNFNYNEVLSLSEESCWSRKWW